MITNVLRLGRQFQMLQYMENGIYLSESSEDFHQIKDSDGKCPKKVASGSEVNFTGTKASEWLYHIFLSPEE